VIPKDKRSEGIGSQFMTDLSQIADRDQKTIKLTPSSDFGGSKTRLKSFYKRFGFVENKGRNKDLSISETMYRRPMSDGQRFSPQRSLNDRGGAIYTTPEGHRAVQTSSRAGVRVYGPTGRRIGPVFQSVEAAERHLSQQ